MPISQSFGLGLAVNMSASVTLALGVNAILRPAHALTFFEMTMPTLPADKKLVESLMTIYGIRDVFMGLSVYAASAYGARKSLGWIMMALSMVAFTDGWVCYQNGHGQWGHWLFVPLGVGLGSLVLGVADGSK